jgi:SAM-dependent methyltransferase
MNTSADDTRLRTFWNERYRSFTLSESGWMGAGEDLNARIYVCKRQALSRALSARGIDSAGGVSVLDAGCGQGFFAQYYRSHFPNAAYTGLDISERAIAHLRETFPDVEFHAGDLSTWTDPHGRRFDVIQSFEVLHLMLDDTMFEAALARFAGMLAPRGVMLLTAAMPDETIERAGYLRYRSRRMWTGALERLGLRIADARPMYFWLPGGGPANRYARALFARLGVGALYAADRAALALGLPPLQSSGIDCRMKLLTVDRAPA